LVGPGVNGLARPLPAKSGHLTVTPP
jgi:hypothetical protein